MQGREVATRRFHKPEIAGSTPAPATKTGGVLSSFTNRLEVTPLDDGRRWKLIRSFEYYRGDTILKETVTVPAGFVTDFASSPRPFWWLVSPWGKYGKAAIIHDFLYQWHGYEYPLHGWADVTRKQADDIFLEAMTVLGVKPWRSRLMYWAVRLFGWFAWRKGAAK